MTRAALLKRIEALEASIRPRPVQRLRFVEVPSLPDSERERLWSGETSVIDAYTSSDARTIIVDVSPASRESWLATRGMTESEIESYETDVDRAEAAAMRKARPVVSESESCPPAVWGWAADGTPIYDNDPRFKNGIGAVFEG